MNEQAAAKRKDEPLLGEAALKAAVAEFSRAPHAPGAAAGAAPAQGHPEAAPKSAPQVLGEITWLMTQRPRQADCPRRPRMAGDAGAGVVRRG